MKKYLFSLILLLISYVGFAQKGLSYQAVILDPNPIEAPGLDISGQPYVNGEVWIKFSIYGTALQYEEVQKTKTDAYGLVNLVIGSVTPAAFNSLVWDSAQKTLQVYVSFNQGAAYTKVSDQKLTYNPYALFAETASKLGGTLPISGGGTGATTLVDARVNLGIDKVDNTSDAQKPVSTATLVALDLKANTADLIAGLAGKADTSSIKTYVVNQVATATITDADVNTKGKIQLAGDLSGTAAAPTVPGLALKANTSDVATDLALKLDANQKGAANGVATLNSLGIIPSNQLPPVTLSSTNVVGSDAAMTALASATVGSIAIRTDANKNYVLSALPASTLTNWVELLTPAAPVQVVNGYTGSVNLTKTDLGLSDVSNTSDLNKPISIATQNALNLKANTTDVNASLNLKANVADMNSALASKANVAALTAALVPKANTTEVDQALNLKLDANKLGVPNGTASLNNLGKIPTDQIPAISFSSVKVLGSQADMLALSSAVVGSVVIRTDVNKNYVLAASDPAVLTNWIELLTPAPPVQTVNGYTGTVSLSKSDLGLSSVDNTSDAAKPISTATQSALSLKANASALAAVATSGSYTDLVNVPSSVSAASLSGIVPIANGGTGASTAAGAIANLGAENTSNKSTNLQTDAESTSKYPSVKLIKDYVDQSISSRAALDSPAFTGTPTAPTAATGTATTQLATTAFVKSAVEAPRNNFYIGVNENLGLGSFTALPSQTGIKNTLIGNFTLQSKIAGDSTTALGHAAGNFFGVGTGLVTSVNRGVYIGAYARANANNQTNEIVIGADALGNGSNTIQLGNTAITNTKTSGTLTAGAVTYPNTHGTANQVLTTNGSGTLTWSTVSGAANASSLSGTVGVANGGTGASTAAAARTNLGLVIGTDVQAPLTAGTDYLAPTGSAAGLTNFPTFNQNTTGNAATASLATNVSGIVVGANGGTGVANSGKTITLAGNFQTIGNDLTLTTTATTNVTLPTSGTLATVQQVDAKATLASPAFTGTPTAPTAATADNSTKIATTEFVKAAISAGNVGIRTIGAISSTSNAKGAVISGTTEFVLTPADASNGGIITTGSQTFAGAKTFANNLVTNGTLTAGTVTYPNTHGTSGNVLSTTGSGTLSWTSLSALGAVPVTSTTGSDVSISTSKAVQNPVGSVSFDGTSQYLTLANNEAFNYGTSNFTIECWINPASLKLADVYLQEPSWSLFFGLANTSGAMRFNINNGANYDPYGVVTTANSLISTNTWNHIVLMRNGNDISLFINGVCRGTKTGISANLIGGSEINSGPKIAGGNKYDGKVANLRVVKGSNVYSFGTTVGTTYFNPPSTIGNITGTQLLLAPTSSTISDLSPNGFAVTKVNTPVYNTAPTSNNLTLEALTTSSLTFTKDGNLTIPSLSSAGIVTNSVNGVLSTTSTIAVANGGTGATTKSAGFDALSPMTTSGDLIYGGASGTGARLAKGNNGTILSMENNVPTWLTSIRATSGSTYNAAVGFSFLGGDWARNTGMFSDNPDSGGSATLKFRIATSNSTADPYLEISPSKVSVYPTTASTSKTTGALTVAGGLGVNGDIYANKLILNSGTAGGASLEVNGASTNTVAFNGGSATSIDFAKSNLAYTTASAGNFTLTGMKDGGAYTLAVQGATSGTAAFSQAGFTFKSINNAATTASKHTLYTFIVMGTNVYYSMVTGL